MRGFSARYNLNRLVYFELFEDMYEAISREKQIYVRGYFERKADKGRLKKSENETHRA
jgi:predicted GIY-YIG superfamily endonuclease